MTGLLSIWLVPAAADEAELRAIIHDLALAFGQAQFSPHLTLAGDVLASESELARLVRAAADGIPRFEAVIEAVDIRDVFFRCLYARFSLCDGLARLRACLVSELGIGPDSGFTPHVSLLYGAKDSIQKRAAQNRLAATLVGRRICFDRVCVVASAEEIPIEEWQVRATVHLSL